MIFLYAITVRHHANAQSTQKALDTVKYNHNQKEGINMYCLDIQAEKNKTNVESEVIPELQIVERETYEQAQTIMRGRVTHHNEIPLNLKSRSLLVGNIFCGH